MDQGIYSNMSWAGNRYALVDEGDTSNGLLHAHYGKVLSVLFRMKGRKKSGCWESVSTLSTYTMKKNRSSSPHATGRLFNTALQP
jgi:hypothetical protein